MGSLCVPCLDPYPVLDVAFLVHQDLQDPLGQKVLPFSHVEDRVRKEPRVGGYRQDDEIHPRCLVLVYQAGGCTGRSLACPLQGVGGKGVERRGLPRVVSAQDREDSCRQASWGCQPLLLPLHAGSLSSLK